MTARLHVVAAGLLTTVQDLGRWGWQSRGVPVAGAMDPRAHRIANALVGNPSDAATLEVTLAGPELEFEDERVFAVAGGDWALTLSGRATSMRAAVHASAGERLRFDARQNGARAYVAVSGGIDVPPVFGSRSTHVPSGMGGYEGRALRRGDRLPLGPVGQTARLSSVSVDESLDSWSGRVRVLPGPQLEWFAPDALDVLQSSPYRVSLRSDRMGYRLEGPPVTRRRHREMISSPTALGVLQVPMSGEPILLMADRQTTGGYPLLASVITADVGRVGQLGPGDPLSFTVCTRPEALAALIAEERALMAFEAGP